MESVTGVLVGVDHRAPAAQQENHQQGYQTLT